MSLTTLTREAVLVAVAEFDRLGRDVFLAKYGYGPIVPARRVRARSLDHPGPSDAGSGARSSSSATIAIGAIATARPPAPAGHPIPPMRRLDADLGPEVELVRIMTT
jgi:hypothetical protein